MSRHRNVRNMDYDEEYDVAYDDSVYGRSVDDHEYGMSPSAEQYMYSRGARDNFGNYFEEGIDEDLEEEYQKEYQKPNLSEEDESRLQSVLDHLRGILIDSVEEDEMVKAVIENKFDAEKSLDQLLRKSPEPSYEQESYFDDFLVKPTKGKGKKKKGGAAQSSVGQSSKSDSNSSFEYTLPLSYFCSSVVNFESGKCDRVPVGSLVRDWLKSIRDTRAQEDKGKLKLGKAPVQDVNGKTSKGKAAVLDIEEALSNKSTSAKPIKNVGSSLSSNLKTLRISDVNSGPLSSKLNIHKSFPLSMDSTQQMREDQFKKPSSLSGLASEHLNKHSTSRLNTLEDHPLSSSSLSNLKIEGNSIQGLPSLGLNPSLKSLGQTRLDNRNIGLMSLDTSTIESESNNSLPTLQYNNSISSNLSNLKSLHSESLGVNSLACLASKHNNENKSLNLLSLSSLQKQDVNEQKSMLDGDQSSMFGLPLLKFKSDNGALDNPIPNLNLPAPSENQFGFRMPKLGSSQSESSEVTSVDNIDSYGGIPVPRSRFTDDSFTDFSYESSFGSPCSSLKTVIPPPSYHKSLPVANTPLSSGIDLTMAISTTADDMNSVVSAEVEHDEQVMKDLDIGFVEEPYDKALHLHKPSSVFGKLIMTTNKPPCVGRVAFKRPASPSIVPFDFSTPPPYTNANKKMKNFV